MARVEVACCVAVRRVEVVALDLPPEATVRDAIDASGLLERHGLDAEATACGVWGRRCELERVLKEGDRVELYRALVVDPKQARRLRFKAQRQAKRPARAGR